jgi:cell pole-organizing protein PopZ
VPPAAAAPGPPAPPPPAADDQGLISQAAAAAATSALTSLVQAVDASRGGTPIGQGARTIEDLVKEVMRPMIKDWLDANLPRLVERLVRKEIERLSHNAEGE